MDISLVMQRAGGVTALARSLGITSQAVSQWKRAPVERCHDIVRATNGAVSLSDLRPDIWPPNEQEQRHAA